MTRVYNDMIPGPTIMVQPGDRPATWSAGCDTDVAMVVGFKRSSGRF